MSKEVGQKKVYGSATLRQLFSEADWIDFLYMFIGTLGGFVTGVAMPLSNFLYGEMMDKMNEDSNMMKNMERLAIMMTVLGAFTIFSGFIQVYCWTRAGERQTQKIREKYVHAILSQEVGWFDTVGPNILSTKVADNIGKIQDGLGRKVGDSSQYFFQFISSYALSFVYEPRLSGLMLVGIPLIGLSSYFYIASTASTQGKSLEQYAKAGGLASETIGAFRTISSLNMQAEAVSSYRFFLFDAMKIGTRKAINVGLSQGSNLAAIFVTCALAFWFGGEIVAQDIEDGCTGDKCVTGGDVTAIFFNALMGSMAIGQLIPPFNAFMSAKAAAYDVFQTIERTPVINNLSTAGLKPDTRLTGKVTFTDVHFAYPSRPDNQICKGYNIEINPGETVALVGPSGCGKSTLINLLLRFYDPNSGSIKVDEYDTNKLNIQWLRAQMGFVGQEPVLFPGSIAQNILAGIRPSVNTHTVISDADMELIVDAAKKSNAHDFITKFPKGYHTNIGSNGGLISGGQKQRIAIARALIKKPSILLLDEATSALDAVSEKIVQASIDELTANKTQTTIVIAHRLSTIKNADKICVVNEGKISEIGTHNELYNKKGLYYELVKLQMESLAAPEAEEIQEETEEIEKDLETGAAVEAGASVRLSTKSGKVSEKEYSKDEEKAISNRVYSYIMRFKGMFITGMCGAFITGTLWPIWGYLLGYSQDMFYKDDAQGLREDSRLYAGLFGLLAGISLFSCFFEYFGVVALGERIASLLRSEMFESYMRQPVSFYDYPANDVGVLTTRLSDDARTVNKAFGESLAKICQSVVCLIISIILSFTASWQMSLLLLGVLPVSILASIVQMQAMTGTQYDQTDDIETKPKVENKKEKEYNEVKKEEEEPKIGHGALISLAFNNIRTVSSFSMHKMILSEYSEVTSSIAKKRVRNSFVAGFAFGFSNLIFFGIYSILFYVGTYLMVQGDISFLDFMISTSTLMMGAMGLGSAMADMSDQGNALAIADSIFKTIDNGLNSLIDGLSPKTQSKPLDYRSQGKIELKNVSFRYPTRPDAKICESYNLTIEPGEVVALVGPSGSGKSTIINLLLRFYDPSSGQILLDGEDIKDVNVRWLRSQIGFVGQEPVLFEGSVMTNIARGLPNNIDPQLDSLDKAFNEARSKEREALKGQGILGQVKHWFSSKLSDPTPAAHPRETVEKVIEASKLANAHDFISKFSKGYDTEVGQKSIMVSGGQKQRIAIARALIKKPSILLLDEATSALDAASEKIVQASIDELTANKAQTTIIVAHRLTTIKNADKICVVNEGKISEVGTHEELIALNGTYKELWDKQNS